MGIIARSTLLDEHFRGFCQATIASPSFGKMLSVIDATSGPGFRAVVFNAFGEYDSQVARVGLGGLSPSYCHVSSLAFEAMDAAGAGNGRAARDKLIDALAAYDAIARAFPSGRELYAIVTVLAATQGRWNEHSLTGRAASIADPQAQRLIGLAVRRVTADLRTGGRRETLLRSSEESWSELIQSCTRFPRTAQPMCILLAELYPSQASAIAQVVIADGRGELETAASG